MGQTVHGFDAEILTRPPAHRRRINAFTVLRHGTAVLESFTTSNKGKRMAIFCQFTEPRVLAAPMITRGNATGIIRFTPDCSRKEAERILAGLNTAIKEIKGKSK